MSNLFNLRAAITGAVLCVVVGAAWIFNRPESSASLQSTDDAYVQADLTAIAPQVAGVIERVAVEDHQAVKKGDLLVQVDDRDLCIALDDAVAHTASAKSIVDGLAAQLIRQQSLIGEARAVVVADDANVKLASANRDRFANLAKDGSGTRQAQQQAEANLKVQASNQDRDQAGLQATQDQVAIIKAQLETARAELQVAKAKQADAELKLSYTRVLAPTAGVVAERRARVGGYVHVGDPMLTLVPLNALYIEANFRETQLMHVRVGQSVAIRIDALPGLQLKGHVESLAPASGVSFSAIPPHNATGNFTKIVQRIPVRIQLDPGQADIGKLRVGMSVRPLIDTTRTNVAALGAVRS